MGELIYMFAAYASRHRDGKTCLEGMGRLAAALHPHGVKITWLVSPESARIAARELTGWHESHGDDVAVDVPFLSGALDDRVRQLSAARKEVLDSLPERSAIVMRMRFGLEDGQIVPLARRVTDNSVVKTGFLRQLLNNIGALNPAEAFGN